MVKTGPLRRTRSLLTAALIGSSAMTSMAPLSSAIPDWDALRSQPMTSPGNWAARNAKPAEAPISPVPTMVMRWMVTVLPHLSVHGNFRPYVPAHSSSDDPKLVHELLELLRKQGLGSVGKGLIRVGMNLDQQPITPCGDCGAGHGRDLVAAANTVRGIGKHRKMRELLDDRDGGDVHGIAGIGFESANASLAKHHIVITAGQDVLRRKQQLFQGRCNAALEQHRLAHQANLAQQIEVLHIARTHLENVNVGKHEIDLRNFHDLADNQQSRSIPHFPEQLETLQSEALERVGRASWLESSSPQKGSPCGLNLIGHRKYLLARFHRARSRHHNNLIAADGDPVGKTNDGYFGPKAAACELVRGRDAHHLGNTGKQFEILVIEMRGRAHARQNGLDSPCSAVNI